MGMRFNKTFKRYRTPEEEFMERYEQKMNNKKVGLIDAFKEKDAPAIGNAIVRWRARGLFAAPCLVFLAYGMFVYTDPVLKKKNAVEERVKIDREKDLLEFDDSV